LNNKGKVKLNCYEEISENVFSYILGEQRYIKTS